MKQVVLLFICAAIIQIRPQYFTQICGISLAPHQMKFKPFT